MYYVFVYLYIYILFINLDFPTAESSNKMIFKSACSNCFDDPLLSFDVVLFVDLFENIDNVLETSGNVNSKKDMKKNRQKRHWRCKNERKADEEHKEFCVIHKSQLYNKEN
ncbi:hypothetical protein RFI_10040 [Reticulomyxa filosa]|uniref:Uncharacterized protein n=1 Tax=Reticulomyxa filosa TaxID=46433 RepID=X6NN07_RETFI|nr:hypothetical protein RFI_10040 [Reticulomyxa filosa]|eukprot:ETO27089.1 hypothetical protein RFI_10040 [Reticulomyxa filosa]